MLKLPTNSQETVIGSFDEYFMPYARISVGDFLNYNPRMDKMVIVPINDRPKYAIRQIRNQGFIKRKTMVTIEKL